MFGLRMLPVLITLVLAAPMAAGDVLPDDVGLTAESVNTVAVGPETLYVVIVSSTSGPQGAELWREAHNCAGLQKVASFVGAKYCSPGDTKLADTTP